MLAFTQLQALTGPEGSSQCLSGLPAFTMARSVSLLNHSSSDFLRFAGVHQTAGTEWARRAHSVLVRPACVHQGKVHNQTLRFEWAEGPHHSSMRFAYVYHVQIHNPTASTA